MRIQEDLNRAMQEAEQRRIMKVYQQAAGVIWLAFGVAVLLHARRLGLGTLHNPGSGFVAFTAASGLTFLALVQIVRDSFSRGAAWTLEPPPLANILKVLPSFVALVVYPLVLSHVGYGLATFALMAALFLLAQRRRYVVAIIAAALTTAATQILFQSLLKTQFPVGPWGF
jgi:putative tricarboxylic transport membrane protein